MADPFGSAREKLRRGNLHHQALKVEFLRLEKEQTERIGLDFELEGKSVLFRELPHKLAIATARLKSAPRLSPDFPLIFGDAIHNFRAALDHLIWALVREQGIRLSARDARHVYFPMHNSAKAFDDLKQMRTPGLPDHPHRAILKRYQPYSRGDGPQAIRWLRHFSDRDKHRVVTPSFIAPQGIRIGCQAPPGVTLLGIKELVGGPVILETGTPVAKVWAIARPDTRDPDVRVDCNFTVLPLLSKRVPADTLLRRIAETVTELIAAFDAL